MRKLLLLTVIVLGASTSASDSATAPSLESRLSAVEAVAKAANDSASSLTFNSGDNAWLLTSTLLVLLMTLPGLALFYSGLVRRKNVLGTMMQSMAIAAVISVLWAIFGYSFAFGPGPKDSGLSKIYGGTNYVMLDKVMTDSDHAKPTATVAADGSITLNEKEGNPSYIPPAYGGYATSIPHGTFMLFQLMFAIITPALICGAYAERMKFSAMMLFTVGWFVLAYLPLAHMVWGENGLFNWGFGAKAWAAFDFAGGTVVHISSGIAALMAALILGPRTGHLKEMMPPHNLTYSFIGACLLWVGWFGFNAGSALNAGPLASLAFANTHFATAAAAIAWPLAEWIFRGKPTVLGAISGAVAGLVAITPAAGFVSPGSALAIGFIGGFLCYSSVYYLKRALRYDDALDAFGVHGIGGMWGAIATGLFFNPEANPGLKALNADLYNSIIAGTHPVVLNQLKAVGLTILISAVVATAVLLLIKYTIGLRLSEDDENTGLDLSQHGEEGYSH